MQRVENVLSRLLGVPQTMSPEELEDRVEVLEAKVRSNEMALQEHVVDPGAHQQETDGVGDQ